MFHNAGAIRVRKTKAYSKKLCFFRKHSKAYSDTIRSKKLCFLERILSERK